MDAEGCRPESLRDPGLLQHLCQRILDGLRLRVVGTGHWHQFPGPGGVTGIYLLTESHLALHTYPESGLATFSLYCCRPRPRWPWEEELGRALGAGRVTIRRLERPAHGSGGPGE